jgi:DMSO/TMAO reductase YedYZ heme-binding membrane subunit
MRDPGFAKFVLFVNSLVPGVLLSMDAYNHHLGAEPIRISQDVTGMTALVFLLLTLSVTPLRKITGWNWLSHFRRMLGLFAFAYASAHFLIYFVFDQNFDFSASVRDALHHYFILLGLAALLMMIPLAITSTNGMIKRLGAARWKQVHWLIYPIAICGVVHYYLFRSAKNQITYPLTFAAILGILLGYRLAARRLGKLRSRPAAAQA